MRSNGRGRLILVYPALKAYLAAQGTALPGYVDREFMAYLKCGRLEHGFLRLRCETCHAEQLLVFSCKGRHFSAWVGLVPGQHSSGGKSTLLGISKRGNAYLRTLFIHGARAVLCHSEGKSDRLSLWAQALKARRGTTRPALQWPTKWREPRG